MLAKFWTASAKFWIDPANSGMVLLKFVMERVCYEKREKRGKYFDYL